MPKNEESFLTMTSEVLVFVVVLAVFGVPFLTIPLRLMFWTLEGLACYCYVGHVQNPKDTCACNREACIELQVAVIDCVYAKVYAWPYNHVFWCPIKKDRDEVSRCWICRDCERKVVGEGRRFLVGNRGRAVFSPCLPRNPHSCSDCEH